MSRSALIVVDMQNDFMQGGTLEVKDNLDIILPVNKLINHFDLVVATKDWHPPNHTSFARNCSVKPFEMVDGQMKWPDHCIAGTWGSEFHKNLNVRNIRAVFNKGLDKDVESYSGVKDANGKDSGLMAYLLELEAVNYFVCGLALDYCVGSTAIHFAEDPWINTYIISDATKAVDPNFVFKNDRVRLITTEQALSIHQNPDL